jgi:protein AaeX
MIPLEIAIGGILAPGLIVSAVLALVAMLFLRRLLSWIGFYGLIWRPALFNAALFLLLLGGIAAISSRT